MVSAPPLPQAPIFRFLVGSAALVILIAGAKYAAPLLNPLLFAILLAIISAPFMRWLERRGLPPKLAMLVLLLGWIVGAWSAGRAAWGTPDGHAQDHAATPSPDTLGRHAHDLDYRHSGRADAAKPGCHSQRCCAAANADPHTGARLIFW